LFDWYESQSQETRSIYVEGLTFIIRWAFNRGIYSNNPDAGYLTFDKIQLMLIYVLQSTDTQPTDSFKIIKKFMEKFSCNFEFNESSIASNVGRCPGESFASGIDENEGIDSDVDEELRRKRLSRKEDLCTSADGSAIAADESPNHPHSSLLENANDNDEVHPHKRSRYELGQIRDMRRFYEVENSRIQKISVMDRNNEFKNKLDLVDVFTVCHPFVGCELPIGEHVNVAIRVLETHKKIFIQEFSRALWYLSDCEDSGVLEQVAMSREELPECTPKIIFQIESNTEYANSVVPDVVQSQVWFLIQELQAYQGLMVVPPCDNFDSFPRMRDLDSEWVSTGRNIAQSHPWKFVRSVTVALQFPADEPYRAKEGMNFDFASPISRVMMRIKRAIQERLDYQECLAQQFTLSCGLVNVV